jgi:hypothetical protein
MVHTTLRSTQITTIAGSSVHECFERCGFDSKPLDR